MRTLFIVSLVVLSFTVSAQSHFELGLTVGGNSLTSLTNIDKYPSSYKVKTPISYVNTYGVNANVKALLDTRKWQFGVCVEGGTLQGKLNRTLAFKEEIDANLPYPLVAYPNTELEQQKVASPYVAPHALVHFKFNFSDAVYMYLGPVGGVFLSKNDLSWNAKSSGWMAGGNLGVVVRLSDRVYLDIAEGWRMAWIRGNILSNDSRREWYNPKVISEANTGSSQSLTSVALAHSSYNLSYGCTSIGVRVVL